MPGEASPTKHHTRPQFGLTALLWTTAVIALALAYLRQFDSPQVFANAAIAVAAACVLGAATGWPTRRMAGAIYWAVVIAAAAFISVAGDPRFPVTYHFAWSCVGAVAGAWGGAIAPRRLWLRMLGGGSAAGFTMLLFAVSQPTSNAEVLFDLMCAPIVGALVGLLIELILWIERQRAIPRYVTASWLLLAVIAGNLMVPWVLD